MLDHRRRKKRKREGIGGRGRQERERGGGERGGGDGEEGGGGGREYRRGRWSSLGMGQAMRYSPRPSAQGREMLESTKG